MELIELPFVKMLTNAVNLQGPQKDQLGWIFIAHQII